MLPSISSPSGALKKLKSGSASGSTSTPSVLDMSDIPVDVFSMLFVKGVFTKGTVSIPSMFIAKNGTRITASNNGKGLSTKGGAISGFSSGASVFTSLTDLNAGAINFFTAKLFNFCSTLSPPNMELEWSNEGAIVRSSFLYSGATTEINQFEITTNAGAHNLTYEIWGLK